MIANDTLTLATIGQPIKNFSFMAYYSVHDKFEEYSFAKALAKKKWIIVFFYPADFTFVCPTELADLAEHRDELAALGVEVISFSTDSHFTHLAWYKAEKLLNNVTFPMGSDPTGEIARFFGVYDQEEGTALRGTFIINPDGILVGSEVNYYNLGRNSTELMRKMRANVYLRSHPTETCPAGWEDGDPTLTPSETLVGKVFEHLEG